MDRFGLAQNVMPAVEVAALFDKTAIEDVDFAADELSQLLFDLEPGHVGWTLAGLEADEEVDIAVVAKILAQERAENLELGDVPLPAEGCQSPGRDREPLAD
jgi:hypothetical protein